MKFKFKKNFYRSFRFWISLLLFISVLMHYSHGFESTTDIFWAIFILGICLYGMLSELFLQKKNG